MKNMEIAASQTAISPNSEENESVLAKSTKAVINLITNILIVLTVFVCLLYSCSSKKFDQYELHIVLCVLGYQFVMCHGMLVLSKYNSWTMYLSRQTRRHLHWILQVISLVMVFVGSYVIIQAKSSNFNTAHGVLALFALIMGLLSLCNGFLVMYASKLIKFISLHWLKISHYVTGMSTLFFAAVSLCLGFDKSSFKSWASGDFLPYLLMIFTWLFTMCVAIDFWIITANRLRNL